MSGYPKQKVYIYEKKTKVKLIDTCESIQEFKLKYLLNYKDSSKLPVFTRKDYIKLDNKLATTIPGGREVYRKYTIDSNEYVKLIDRKKPKWNKTINVYNLKDDLLGSFANVIVASKFTGVPLSTILYQIRSKRKDNLKSGGLIFKEV